MFLLLGFLGNLFFWELKKIEVQKEKQYGDSN